MHDRVLQERYGSPPCHGQTFPPSPPIYCDPALLSFSHEGGRYVKVEKSLAILGRNVRKDHGVSRHKGLVGDETLARTAKAVVVSCSSKTCPSRPSHRVSGVSKRRFSTTACRKGSLKQRGTVTYRGKRQHVLKKNA